MPVKLSANEVWNRVHAFASARVQDQAVVHTLQKKVRNVITDVKPASIGRISDDGRTNSSRVTLGMVASVWEALCAGKSWKDGTRSVLYFTPALMLNAMPDILEDLGDGEIGISRLAAVKKSKQQRARLGGRAAGGEGPVHKRLRLFIHANPDEALRNLPGAPWRPFATERVFDTGDRVDVFLRDCDGNFVLVEVKPSLDPKDRSPFAQAAKYRTLLHVLEGVPLGAIRTVVAAPNVPRRLAKRMHEQHGIESVAVRDPG